MQGYFDIIPSDAAVETDAFCADVENVDVSEQLKRDTEKVIQQITRQVNIKYPYLGEWTYHGATIQVITATTVAYGRND